VLQRRLKDKRSNKAHNPKTDSAKSLVCKQSMLKPKDSLKTGPSRFKNDGIHRSLAQEVSMGGGT